MSDKIYFFYGNQSLDLKEHKKALIEKLVPPELFAESVFRIDAGDFYFPGVEGKDLLADFRNTCETVSFFTPLILIDLENLQKIKAGKSNTETLEKALQAIELVEVLSGENVEWHEASSITSEDHLLSRTTAKSMVGGITPYTGKRYWLDLHERWKSSSIISIKNNNKTAMSVREFLRAKLKAEILFAPLEEETPLEDFSGNFLNLLKSYIENPPEQVIFVCSALIRKPTELPGKLAELFSKNAKQIKTMVTYDDFAPSNWVRQRAERRGLQTDPVVADLFVQLVGNDLETLDMELEKLSLLFPQGANLTPEILLKSVSHSKASSIFRIAEFLSNRDLNNATESLELAIGEHPSETIGLFGLISAQFRRFLKIAWMRKNHLEEKSIVSILGLNPWIAKMLIRHADNFSVNELENIVIQLAMLDLQIKYSGADALSHLKNLCFQICSGEFARSNHLIAHWTP